MAEETDTFEQSKSLLESLQEASTALDQLAGHDPEALSRAVTQLRALAEGAGDGSCGGRFLNIAYTYLNYSAWVRSPLGSPIESEPLG